MPILTRAFRVFVSSTFEDMKAERDVLQREVFPKLRELCEAHSARFQAIDLRWGVRDEAALDQKTMEICLHEIERCQHTGIKPNFIVLLGQRYGWRPLPSRIEAREFAAVRYQVSVAEDWALVDDWFRRDDNAVPPEYVLTPRSGEWAEPVQWQEIETRLHRILLAAARAAGLSAPALAKYEVSATHQEILKGLGTTVEEHRHVFAFCRQVPDEVCDPDLIRLKSFLHAQLPAENILSYTPDDFRGLCRDVEGTLRRVIESAAAGFESRTPLALEIEAHDAFAHERALVFGREDVFEALTEYVKSGSDQPLVLHGVSGSGKSAVMAQASEQARMALRSAVMIRRFIGASPESSNGLTLLRSLAEEIGEAYGGAGEVHADFSGMARLFRERLTRATAECPLVVFIDALDQLGKDDPARSFTWLGGILPAHCHLVVSTTELVPALNECRVVKLEALPEADAATALDHWLGAAHRQLQPAQRERLLAAFGRCRLPLYLKLAFEEARGWASDLPLEECRLGEGVEGIIDALLNRLAHEANHGPLLVSRSLGYLAAARYGLTEDEMLDVLSGDEEVWQDFERRAHHTPPERRLPIIVWSRLFLDLEAYLAERTVPGGVVATFYHRQLAERAAARFLGSEDGRRRHARLAAYFQNRPQGLRQLDELPWQWQEAGEWRRLAELLAEPGFFDALWEKNEFEVRAYWTSIETQSVLRMERVYAAVIQEPSRLPDHAGQVGQLLADTGKPEAALRVQARLVEHYRKQGDRARLAGGLDNQANTLYARGDLDGALALHKEEDLLWRELDNKVGLAYSMNNQALILQARGDLDGAMGLLQKIERFWRELGYSEGLESSLGNQALILQARGDLGSALALLKETEHLCRELGNKAGLATSLGNQAMILKECGNLDGAMCLCKEQERLCRELGDKYGLSYCLGSQGLVLRALGDLDGALVLHRDQERLCRELGNKAVLQASLGNQANVLQARGDLNGAMHLYKEQEILCRELGYKHPLATSLSNQALILQTRGDLDGAMRLSKEQERLCRDNGYKAELQASLANQAYVLRTRGDLDGAMSLYKEQESLGRDHGNKVWVQASLVGQAYIHQAREDLDGALALYNEAEGICRELGNKVGLQESLANRTLILQARGDLDGAMRLSKEHERLCRELANPHGLAISLANQASLLSSIRGRGREARRLVDEALAIATRHGYQQLVPRIKQIRDSISPGGLLHRLFR